MAIKWMVNNTKYRGVRENDNVRITYNKGSHGSPKLALSIPTFISSQFSKTGYVLVGYDDDSGLFFVKEALSKTGFKICCSKTSDNRVYVRVPFMTIGISEEKALSLEGEYTVKKFNNALYSLKKKG